MLSIKYVDFHYNSGIFQYLLVIELSNPLVLATYDHIFDQKFACDHVLNQKPKKNYKKLNNTTHSHPAHGRSFLNVTIVACLTFILLDLFYVVTASANTYVGESIYCRCLCRIAHRNMKLSSLFPSPNFACFQISNSLNVT